MKIGIIGAGATGLTSAYYLGQKQHEVTLIDAANDVGGLVSTVRIGNTAIEKFYHHIFTSDTYLIDLVQELGLSHLMRWIEPKNAIYIDKKLYPFSTPQDLLRFKPLPFLDRIRMGLTVLMAKNVQDYRVLETMTAKDWIIQRAGQAAYDKVWGPLLYSKFDIDAESVSAVWIWNKFKLRGSTRSKGMSKELLGYMAGGFGQIYEKLEEKIRAQGGQFIFESKVSSIESLPNGQVLVRVGEAAYTFDKLLITFAPRMLSEMNTPFSKEYLNQTAGIRYKANICMILETKQAITPFYWTTIADRALPFVVLVEQTNFMYPSDYGTHVTYLARYIDDRDPFFSSSEENIQKAFLDGLKEIAPDFDHGNIRQIHFHRARFTQPVITREYSKKIPAFQTPVKNIYLATMVHIYPQDRGQNYSMKIGKEVIKPLLED